jgi:hypothetical protein
MVRPYNRVKTFGPKPRIRHLGRDIRRRSHGVATGVKTFADKATELPPVNAPLAIGKIDHLATARHPSQKACGGGGKILLDYDSKSIGLEKNPNGLRFAIQWIANRHQVA